MFKVDESTCLGCGACLGIAPEAFEMDEKGLSKPIEGAELTDDVREAAGACPVGAISIEEAAEETTEEQAAA